MPTGSYCSGLEVFPQATNKKFKLNKLGHGSQILNENNKEVCWIDKDVEHQAETILKVLNGEAFVFITNPYRNDYNHLLFT